MSTVTSSPNWSFSQKASKRANDVFYPLFLKVSASQIKFIDTLATSATRHQKMMDLELGIDKCVQVKGTTPGLKLPIEFTVQERWRKPDAMKWRDVTLREWNPNSNTPSELYKINSDFLVYGYYDDVKDKILAVYVISIPLLKISLIAGKLKKIDKRQNKSVDRTTFWGFNLDELESNGIIVYTYKPKVYKDAVFYFNKPATE